MSDFFSNVLCDLAEEFGSVGSDTIDKVIKIRDTAQKLDAVIEGILGPENASVKLLTGLLH
jgi:hypothetical protein